MTTDQHHSGKSLSREDPIMEPTRSAIERAARHEAKALDEAAGGARFGGSGRALAQLHAAYSLSWACAYLLVQLSWLLVAVRKRGAGPATSCHSFTSTTNSRPRRGTVTWSRGTARPTSTHDGMTGSSRSQGPG